MYGYFDEVMKVGVIDNDDMREYAFCQLQAADKLGRKINPRVWWNI